MAKAPKKWNGFIKLGSSQIPAHFRRVAAARKGGIEMRQGGHLAVRLILLFVLVAGLTPTWAHADDYSPRQPLRHRATAVFVPIGMVYSSGAMFINQRRRPPYLPIR